MNKNNVNSKPNIIRTILNPESKIPPQLTIRFSSNPGFNPPGVKHFKLYV